MKRSGSREWHEEVGKIVRSGVEKSGSWEWRGEVRKSGMAGRCSGSRGRREEVRYFWAIRYFVEIPGYSGSPSYHKQPSGKFGGIRYSRDVRIDIGCLDPNPNPNPNTNPNPNLTYLT